MSEIEILYAELLNNQNPLHCTRKELCDAVDSAAKALQEKQEREKECPYKLSCGWCRNFDKPCQEACGRKLGENDG